MYPNLIKGNRRMSTCNRLDLQTLGSQPVMPKNIPEHWFQVTYVGSVPNWWPWSILTVIREIFVFASPTGYMLTSSSFPLSKWGIFYKIPLKWSVIFLQSGTSTSYFSNSTVSFVTNCRFSPKLAYGQETKATRCNKNLCFVWSLAHCCFLLCTNF